MAWVPKVGETVIIKWGTGELEAVVRRVHDDPPMFPYLLVEVPVHGSSGEVLETTTVTVTLDDVRPAAELPPARRRRRAAG